METGNTTKSLTHRATTWVESTFDELADQATVTVGNIEFDRENAETLAYAHAYEELQRVAADPTRGYGEGARSVLQTLGEPEYRDAADSPDIDPDFLPFYEDANKWVADDAYQAMVRETCDPDAQASLGILQVAADGGEQTDGGGVADGGIAEDDIEPSDGVSAEKWLDNLPLRIIGGTVVVTAAAGGIGYALLDSDNDGLQNYEELAHGTDHRTGDTSGDGIRDGTAVGLGLNPTDQYPAVGNLTGQLDNNDLTASEKDWLRLVMDNPNNTVPQVVEQGYHEDGEITADELNQSRDNDADGLIKALDPDDSDPDVDGDGFVDGVEYQCLEDSNVSRMDIYVEIDRMEGVDKLSPRAEERIVEHFDNAPVEGGGINLHLVYSEVVPASDELYTNETEGELNDFDDYYDAFYDHDGEGYHYVLLANGEVINEGEDVGGVSPFPGAFVDSPIYRTGGENSSDTYAMTGFIHELGHSLGLRSAYVGIDTLEIPFEKYPSVMNGNVGFPFAEDIREDRFAFYGYSDGTNSEQDFDDWGYLENNLYTPPTDAFREDGEITCGN